MSCRLARRRAATLLGCSLVATLAGAACSGRSVELPPIAPDATNAYRPGRVVWHDLVTPDLDVATRFYGALLGWQFDDPQKLARADYVLARLNGRPVAGFARARSFTINTTQWVSYFSVPDVDSAAARVGASGGRIYLPPTDVPGRGRAALMADPQGAIFAVLHATGGDPVDGVGPVNGFLWHELWTVDTGAAASWYGSLMGYRATSRQLENVAATYTLFRRDDIPRAGMLRIPVEGVRPNWLPTVRVVDVAAIVARATELGGRVILAPRPDLRKGTVAIIQDPSGAALTIQQWGNGL